MKPYTFQKAPSMARVMALLSIRIDGGFKTMKQLNFKVIYKNWWVHNIVAHPLMQILGALGFVGIGDSLHDATLPEGAER